jgi:rubrerythrin
MGSIKGTRTEKNLLAAFAGECQASTRYTFFAKKAKKEGFEQIAALFGRTAEEERAHASTFYKSLEGGDVEIQAAYSAGGNGTTAQNLRASAAGEHEEWTQAYPAFAAVAREEGFPAAARIFEAVATVERSHESRHLGLLAHVEAGTVFQRSQSAKWRCRNCGYIHEGTAAPESCPACMHAQAYFEVLGEDW